MPGPLNPFLLTSYRYHLPEDRIAQEPALKRDASRLMLLDRQSGQTRCAAFADIISLLPERALLVANNSRVAPARLVGTRPGGGKVEVLLLSPPPLLEQSAQHNENLKGLRSAEAEMLLRPAKKVRPGDIIRLDDELQARLLEHGPFGRCRVLLSWRGDLRSILEKRGSVPLPPYIKRPSGLSEEKVWGSDVERYQTAYAHESKAGSMAAPTAGLHFSGELLRALAASGREWTELTLYVGYGTFSPVRCDDIREHPMHVEYVDISEACAAAVCRAKSEGRPVVAVGTTSARSLEGAFKIQQAQKQSDGSPFLAAFSGWTDIFLYPGKDFHVIDGLITNFHLPESSLLMLVCALAGRDRVLAAYNKAIDSGFRFFSYGDAMFII
ncbi:tRNA preQ1(34) S-adenosylmethionine ribosyltransferase-isomerase QueA [Desulfovibrio sp. OttesenSCG-928-M16]|nr:tRNA preQ1(34) S-adenosylmethionine ribosyltransferase-isomerase QueA [Desulfovibrio sp. OttesenSCG-928-M16]